MNFMDKYTKAVARPQPLGGMYALNAPLAPAVVGGDVGLEIELEGASLPSGGYLASVRGKTSGTTWQVKTDGSLRGGFEYVFSQPANIDEVPELVHGLYDVFKQRGTKLQLSNRCSTHVHLNVSSYRVNVLTSFLATWMAFEKKLIEWCGVNRVANHFCLSSYDTPALAEFWSSFLTSGNLRPHEGFKYTALNIRTLQQFGSFEIRCGDARDNPEDVVAWTKLLHGISKYCEEHFQNPLTIAANLSENGASHIFQDIIERAGVENTFGSLLRDRVDFDRESLEGFRHSQKFVHALPWYELMDEINREFIPNPFDAPSKKVKTAVDFATLAETRTRVRHAAEWTTLVDLPRVATI